jgi:hypothetical protein
LKNAKGNNDAIRALFILDQFATPYNSAEGQAPLFLSLGRVMFNAD